MSTLHMLSKAPSDRIPMQNCCDALASKDVLLLIEDGVYHATKPLCANLQTSLQSGLKVFVRTLDVKARGIETQILPGMVLVEDSEWVDLCLQYQPIVSWY